MNSITFKIADITQLDADAIVNAAKQSLLGGSGVDGAIHRAAGPGLLAECRTLGGCRTGDAKITKGYCLKARHVIHTVGPIYSGSPQDPQLLASCYRRSLDVARENGLHSVAFPAISTGIYGYPKRDAALVALTAIRTWLSAHPGSGIDVIICCFDRYNYDIYKEAEAKLIGAEEQ